MAQLKIYVHGVPRGHDLWTNAGTIDDKAYLDTFYTAPVASSPQLLWVELRTVEGQRFAYYHWLCYQGIVSAEGRAGSYFGLTLRSDQYISDLPRLYAILEATFTQNIVGSLLLPVGTAQYRYALGELRSQSAVLSSAFQALLQRLQHDLSDVALVPISVQPQPDAALSVLNLADTRHGIPQEWLATHRLVITPTAPLQREEQAAAQHEAQLQQLTAQHAQQQAQAEQEFAQAAEQHALAQQALMEQLSHYASELEEIAQVQHTLTESVAQLSADNAQLQQRIDALHQQMGLPTTAAAAEAFPQPEQLSAERSLLARLKQWLTKA